VFPDVPTEFPEAQRLVDRPDALVTVVNSFSYDEPLAEVLQAARTLPEVTFVITGDVRRCPPEIRDEAPPNARFTGFVPKKEYVDTVFSSDAVVVLTTENHTMQRGAYEAMSMGVPIVTSDWPILRETFSRGTIYTDNTSDSIAAAVRTVLAERPRYRAEIADLKRFRRQHWAERLDEFFAHYLA
jgi:glycosyltransferase involved in cell wall biosynthesis